MTIMDRIIGIWMIIAGGELFIFANMIAPYMDALSGITLCVVAVATAILIGVPVGCMLGYGTGIAIGLITINIAEGGK